VRPVILAVLAIGIVVASSATACLADRGRLGEGRRKHNRRPLFVYGGPDRERISLHEQQPGRIDIRRIMYILLGVVANWIGSMMQPLPINQWRLISSSLLLDPEITFLNHGLRRLSSPCLPGLPGMAAPVRAPAS
jgi:hypothetical protein